MDEMHITKDVYRSLGDDHPLCEPIDAIQDNIIAYNRMFADLPEITWHETDDSLWYTNMLGVPEPSVLRAQFTPDTVDQRVDEIFDLFKQQDATPIDWGVYRTCTPDNLGEKLVEHGLTVGRIPWMLMELDDLPNVYYPDDGFHIEQVTDNAMMAVWRDVSTVGFQMESAQIFYDAYSRQGYDSDGEIVHYIGYHDQQPVTSASLLCAGGIPGLYNISTPPEFRGKGYGTAITHMCLKEARSRDYQYACVMPSPMGRPIYRKLGFVVSMEIPEYRWTHDNTPS